MSIYIYIYICIYMCIYIYMYYIHTYIHTYIHDLQPKYLAYGYMDPPRFLIRSSTLEPLNTKLFWSLSPVNLEPSSARKAKRMARLVLHEDARDLVQLVALVILKEEPWITV